MKRLLTAAVAMCVPFGALMADGIGIDSVMEWPYQAVERALDTVGLQRTADADYDARLTGLRILKDLLEMRQYSLRAATDVCAEKCQMIDAWANARVLGGDTKCNDMCRRFAYNIALETVRVQSDAIAPGEKIDIDIQGGAVDVCNRLIGASGMSLPVLCGGHCRRVGDDVVTLTDGVNQVEYTVDDFCDSESKNEDYYYVITDERGALDVSDETEQSRLEQLQLARVAPVADDQRLDKIRQAQALDDAYDARVAANGQCAYSSLEIDSLRSDCEYVCRAHAQKFKCSLRNYSAMHVMGEADRVQCECNISEDPEIASAYKAYYEYEYSPSYSECVLTYDEKTCAE